MPYKIDESRCRGCGACVMACPSQNIKIVGGKAKIGKRVCKKCGACVEICPEHAIVEF